MSATSRGTRKRSRAPQPPPPPLALQTALTAQAKWLWGRLIELCSGSRGDCPSAAAAAAHSAPASANVGVHAALPAATASPWDAATLAGIKEQALETCVQQLLPLAVTRFSRCAAGAQLAACSGTAAAQRAAAAAAAAATETEVITPGQLMSGAASSDSSRGGGAGRQSRYEQWVNVSGGCPAGSADDGAARPCLVGCLLPAPPPAPQQGATTAAIGPTLSSAVLCLDPGAGLALSDGVRPVHVACIAGSSRVQALAAVGGVVAAHGSSGWSLWRGTGAHFLELGRGARPAPASDEADGGGVLHDHDHEHNDSELTLVVSGAEAAQALLDALLRLLASPTPPPPPAPSPNLRPPSVGRLSRHVTAPFSLSLPHPGAALLFGVAFRLRAVDTAAHCSPLIVVLGSTPRAPQVWWWGLQSLALQGAASQATGEDAPRVRISGLLRLQPPAGSEAVLHTLHDTLHRALLPLQQASQAGETLVGLADSGAAAGLLPAGPLPAPLLQHVLAGPQVEVLPQESDQEAAPLLPSGAAAALTVARPPASPAAPQTLLGKRPRSPLCPSQTGEGSSVAEDAAPSSQSTEATQAVVFSPVASPGAALVSRASSVASAASISGLLEVPPSSARKRPRLDIYEKKEDGEEAAEDSASISAASAAETLQLAALLGLPLPEAPGSCALPDAPPLVIDAVLTSVHEHDVHAALSGSGSSASSTREALGCLCLDSDARLRLWWRGAASRGSTASAPPPSVSFPVASPGSSGCASLITWAALDPCVGAHPSLRPGAAVRVYLPARSSGGHLPAFKPVHCTLAAAAASSSSSSSRSTSTSVFCGFDGGGGGEDVSAGRPPLSVVLSPSPSPPLLPRERARGKSGSNSRTAAALTCDTLEATAQALAAAVAPATTSTSLPAPCMFWGRALLGAAAQSTAAAVHARQAIETFAAAAHDATSAASPSRDAFNAAMSELTQRLCSPQAATAMGPRPVAATANASILPLLPVPPAAIDATVSAAALALAHACCGQTADSGADTAAAAAARLLFHRQGGKNTGLVSGTMRLRAAAHFLRGLAAVLEGTTAATGVVVGPFAPPVVDGCAAPHACACTTATTATCTCSRLIFAGDAFALTLRLSCQRPLLWWGGRDAPQLLPPGTVLTTTITGTRLPGAGALVEAAHKSDTATTLPSVLYDPPAAYADADALVHAPLLRGLDAYAQTLERVSRCRNGDEDQGVNDHGSSAVPGAARPSAASWTVAGPAGHWALQATAPVTLSAASLASAPTAPILQPSYAASIAWLRSAAGAALSLRGGWAFPVLQDLSFLAALSRRAPVPPVPQGPLLATPVVTVLGKLVAARLVPLPDGAPTGWAVLVLTLAHVPLTDGADGAEAGDADNASAGIQQTLDVALAVPVTTAASPPPSWLPALHILLSAIAAGQQPLLALEGCERLVACNPHAAPQRRPDSGDPSPPCKCAVLTAAVGGSGSGALASGRGGVVLVAPPAGTLQRPGASAAPSSGLMAAVPWVLLPDMRAAYAALFSCVVLDGALPPPPPVLPRLLPSSAPAAPRFPLWALSQSPLWDRRQLRLGASGNYTSSSSSSSCFSVRVTKLLWASLVWSCPSANGGAGAVIEVAFDPATLGRVRGSRGWFWCPKCRDPCCTALLTLTATLAVDDGTGEALVRAVDTYAAFEVAAGVQLLATWENELARGVLPSLRAAAAARLASPGHDNTAAAAAAASNDSAHPAHPLSAAVLDGTAVVAARRLLADSLAAAMGAQGPAAMLLGLPWARLLHWGRTCAALGGGSGSTVLPCKLDAAPQGGSGLAGFGGGEGANGEAVLQLLPVSLGGWLPPPRPGSSTTADVIGLRCLLLPCAASEPDALSAARRRGGATPLPASVALALSRIVAAAPSTAPTASHYVADGYPYFPLAATLGSPPPSFSTSSAASPRPPPPSRPRTALDDSFEVPDLLGSQPALPLEPPDILSEEAALGAVPDARDPDVAWMVGLAGRRVPWAVLPLRLPPHASATETTPLLPAAASTAFPPPIDVCLQRLQQGLQALAGRTRAVVSVKALRPRPLPPGLRPRLPAGYARPSPRRLGTEGDEEGVDSDNYRFFVPSGKPASGEGEGERGEEDSEDDEVDGGWGGGSGAARAATTARRIVSAPPHTASSNTLTLLSPAAAGAAFTAEVHAWLSLATARAAKAYPGDVPGTLVAASGVALSVGVEYGLDAAEDTGGGQGLPVPPCPACGSTALSGGGSGSPPSAAALRRHAATASTVLKPLKLALTGLVPAAVSGLPGAPATALPLPLERPLALQSTGARPPRRPTTTLRFSNGVTAPPLEFTTFTAPKLRLVVPDAPGAVAYPTRTYASAAAAQGGAAAAQ